MPYAERIGKITDFRHINYAPDKAAFAALQQEFSKLEEEFWGC
jgi:hypothetical protein